MLAQVTDDSSSAGSQTVDRALRLLDLLGPGPHSAGLTVSEMSRELGVGRPVVYRLIRSLEARQFVRRLADGRYALGYAVFRLSSAVADELARAAVPALRVLADEVGATAHLTLAQGAEAVAAAVVEPSWTAMHVTYRVGARHPLDRGAAGRAILASREGDQQPVASTGELQGGAHGLAIAVHGLEGEASVGVVSLQPLDPAEVGPRLVAAAEQIAEAYRSR